MRFSENEAWSFAKKMQKEVGKDTASTNEYNTAFQKVSDKEREISIKSVSIKAYR